MNIKAEDCFDLTSVKTRKGYWPRMAEKFLTRHPEKQFFKMYRRQSGIAKSTTFLPENQISYIISTGGKWGKSAMVLGI